MLVCLLPLFVSTLGYDLRDFGHRANGRRGQVKLISYTPRRSALRSDNKTYEYIDSLIQDTTRCSLDLMHLLKCRSGQVLFLLK